MWKNILLLIMLGILMGALPFGEQPHLLQKWNLFVNGWLHKPIDWLDFAFHGLPLVLAIFYAAFAILRRNARNANDSLDR